MASRESPPLVAPGRGSTRQRLALGALGLAIRASLLVSPKPAALLIRRLFASTGAQTAAALERHTPAGVGALVDDRYGDEPDMLLDLYRPERADGPLPLVVWVHGGAFVGGSKEELGGWFRILAGHGYAVAGVRYSLAPEQRYPTPTRQVVAALAYLAAGAERLGLDPERIALGGDSAGAQVAAQVGALLTTPGYAEAVGIAPAIAPGRVRALVLACGPYDVALAGDASSPAGRRFIDAVLWAYSGTRRYLDDPRFATLSVTDHLTPAFPPALVTAGIADPLLPHSLRLVERLQEQGLEPETLFFADDHRPPLGHEYQFDLDSEAGRLFLERLLAFLERELGGRR